MVDDLDFYRRWWLGRISLTKLSRAHEMTGAPAQQGGQPSKAKVFISYSRKDIAFADRLDAALKARGFEPLIDRTDIYAFEEWWKRVEDLIGCADTVVFVLSPAAVRPGSVSLKEVVFAASLNKRFAPIVFRPVQDKDVPEALAKLNFIFFDDPARFEQSTDQLAEALNTDISYLLDQAAYRVRRAGPALGSGGRSHRIALALAGAGAGGTLDRIKAERRACTNRRDTGLR